MKITEDYIREKLQFPKTVIDSLRGEMQSGFGFDNQRYRFNMSGYGRNVESYNRGLLNLFEEDGIFDYSFMLNVNFHKGMVTLYFFPFEGDCEDSDNMIIEDLSGKGTVDIIFRIFELNHTFGRKRRRE